MPRSVALAVAGAAALLAVPLPSATACPPSPSGPLELSRERVAPGGSLRVAGRERVTFHCPTGGPQSPTPSALTATTSPPSAAPSGTAGPSASTTPVAPAPLAAVPAPAAAPEGSARGHSVAAPAAAAAPAGPAEHPSRREVVVELEGPAYSSYYPPPVQRVVGRAKPYGTLGRQRFTATARIPGDVPPGLYHLRAYQPDAAGFGDGIVEVAAGLPDTGAPVAELVRLGVLSLVTGAGALAAARRRG